MQSHRIVRLAFTLMVLGFVIAPSITRAQLLNSYLSDQADAAVRVQIQPPAEATQQEQSFLGKFRRFLGIRRAALRPAIGTKYTVQSSGYAPSPYQTDATPCITAAGTTVRSGVVASNFLPLGTILDINGQEYIVEDRMNPRYDGYYIDIWFPSTSRALEFGRRNLDITILGYGEPGQSIRDLDPEADATVESITPWQQVKSTVTGIVGLARLLGARNPDQYDVDCFSD